MVFTQKNMIRTIMLVWTPHFGTMRSHSMAKLAFYLKMIYLLENDLESPLIFVLFLKG